MSQSCYNKIFETIKANLVPKVQLEDSQNEIQTLWSMVEALQSDVKTAEEDVKRMKSKYEDEKLKIEIIQAEKECLQSKMKTLELKSNELSLKLKLKTKQYDALVSSRKTDCKSNDTEKISTGSQTVKEEPTEIGIVNVPASSRSSSGFGSKRPNSISNDEKRKVAKRKKTACNSRSTKIYTRNKPKFTCEVCIDNWGWEIEYDFDGDPDKKGAPDPKESISTFNNFADYKHHIVDDHELFDGETFCKEKSCLRQDDHGDVNCPDSSFASHGDIICKICDLSFKFQQHHDHHMEIAHADLNMKKKQFHNLFLKYKHIKC